MRDGGFWGLVWSLGRHHMNKKQSRREVVLENGLETKAADNEGFEMVHEHQSTVFPVQLVP